MAAMNFSTKILLLLFPTLLVFPSALAAQTNTLEGVEKGVLVIEDLEKPISGCATKAEIAKAVQARLEGGFAPELVTQSDDRLLPRFELKFDSHGNERASKGAIVIRARLKVTTFRPSPVNAFEESGEWSGDRQGCKAGIVLATMDVFKFFLDVYRDENRYRPPRNEAPGPSLPTKPWSAFPRPARP